MALASRMLMSSSSSSSGPGRAGPVAACELDARRQDCPCLGPCPGFGLSDPGSRRQVVATSLLPRMDSTRTVVLSQCRAHSWEFC